MRLVIGIAIIISALAMVFVFQNITETTVKFFGMTFEGPLAIVIFITLLAGFLAGALFMIPSLYKAKRVSKEEVVKGNKINE